MCGVPGVRACALVDSGSGLVIEAFGEGAGESRFWEAAVDYWRTHFRVRSNFEEMHGLGEIGAIAIYHAGGTIAMVPCVTVADLVVICIGDSSGVDWREWQRRARRLDTMISGR